MATEQSIFGGNCDTEPQLSERGIALRCGFGTVVSDGKKQAPQFDPSNAWELEVTVLTDAHPFKSPSEIRYARTQSGTTVAMYYHFITADDALRGRVRSIIEIRFKQLTDSISALP